VAPAAMKEEKRRNCGGQQRAPSCLLYRISRTTVTLVLYLSKYVFVYECFMATVS
jgi:hypothetical protein